MYGFHSLSSSAAKFMFFVEVLSGHQALLAPPNSCSLAKLSNLANVIAVSGNAS